MTRDDDRHFIRTALSIIRAPRPSWIKKGDLRGTEHIRREDVTWPETRGIEPEAKSVRQVLARIFRIRWDGAPVTVSLSSFCKVRDAVQMVAFDRLPALEHGHQALYLARAKWRRALLAGNAVAVGERAESTRPRARDQGS